MIFRRGRLAPHYSCLFWLIWLMALPAAGFGQYGPPVQIAALQDGRVTESSGLASSRLYPDPVSGVLWTHNDSGNGPYLFATNRQGAAIACFEVAGAVNVDWEDLAEGPGPALYIADIGDNNRTRSNLAVYRVAEPDAYRSEAFPLLTATKAAARFPFRYPGGAHYDAETLLIHPETGDACIVTKEASGTSRVFQFPRPLTKQFPGIEVTLVHVATITFSSLFSYGRMVTGGDIAPDGRKIVLRTYTQAYEWPVHPGQSIGQALSQNTRTLFSLPFAQGESIAYRSDGRALLFTHEASPCPLYELPPRENRFRKYHAGRKD